MAAAEDLENYYRIPPDLRDLNYCRFFNEGEEKISDEVDYNSHNTMRLNITEMKTLLMKVQLIQDIIHGRQ
jgi:UDP-glucose 4-epimerase